MIARQLEFGHEVMIKSVAFHANLLPPFGAMATGAWLIKKDSTVALLMGTFVAALTGFFLELREFIVSGCELC